MGIDPVSIGLDLLGLVQGSSQQHAANKQLALQQQALSYAQQIAASINANQQQLFSNAAPAYGQLINQLLYSGGFGGINAAGAAPVYGPIGGNGQPAYQGQGAGAPAPGVPNIAVPQFNWQGQQTTGYGPGATQAPVGTAPGVGHPFAAFGSRKTLPGFNTGVPAQTPLAAPQAGSSAGAGTALAGRTPGIADYLQGVYNLPQQQLQFRAAQEDINRATQQSANALRFNLGVQGAGANTIAAALARNAQAGQESEASFRRGLAENAGQLQQQRTLDAVNALQPGLAAGTNTNAGNLASNVGSQLGAAGQNQQTNANQTFSGIAQNLAAQQQSSLLNQYANQQKVVAPGANYWQGGAGQPLPPGLPANQVPVGPGGGAPIPGGNAPLGTPQFAAGGHIPAHELATVGEGGAETFLPDAQGTKPAKAATVNIPAETFSHWLRHTISQISQVPVGQHPGMALAMAPGGSPAPDGAANHALRTLFALPEDPQAYPMPVSPINAQDFRTAGHWLQSVPGQVAHWWHTQTAPSQTPITPDGRAAIQGLAAYLQTVGSPEMTVPGSPGYLMPPQRATGGAVAGGQDYLVGEGGPELFRPDVAGTILPNPQTTHPLLGALSRLEALNGGR